MLRLNVPRSAAALLLAPIVTALVRRHPGMRVEVVTDDALVDIVAGGFDAGIRFGESLMRDMVAVRLGPDMRLAVVASPGYLALHGRPEKPHDLRDHLCIRRRFPSGAIYRWELERRGKPLEVDVQGPLTLDDSGMILQCAAAGAGIAMVFEQEAQPFLSSGALTRVLEEWCPTFPGMYLYYPSRRQMPAGLRAFISTAREISGKPAA
jgi:DNA-binding transcriptional LysR family regulator